MKFDITRQSIFSVLLTLVVMSVVGLCALVNIESSEGVIYLTESLLGEPIVQLQRSHPTLSAIFSAIAVLSSAVWLGRVATVFNLYGISTTIQLFITGSLMWCAVACEEYLLASIIASLTSLAIGHMLRIVKVKDLADTFNAWIALSLLPLIYPPSVVMWLSLPIILITTDASLRVAIVSIVGLLLIPLATIYIYWLCGADFLATLASNVDMLTANANLLSTATIPIFQTAMLGISALLAIISLVWIGGLIHRTRVRFTIIFTLILCAACTIFIPSFTMLSLPLLAPPLALAASFALARLRGIVATITYILFIILLLLLMFSPIYLPLEQLAHSL